MLDHFHKSGVFINPVFHAGSCAHKIETFAFWKRTKTETATCLLVMIFTKGPRPQSFKSVRAFQQPSAFSFPASTKYEACRDSVFRIQDSVFRIQDSGFRIM